MFDVCVVCVWRGLCLCVWSVCVEGVCDICECGVVCVVCLRRVFLGFVVVCVWFVWGVCVWGVRV